MPDAGCVRRRDRVLGFACPKGVWGDGNGGGDTSGRGGESASLALFEAWRASRALENQLGGLAREFETDLPRERVIEICDDVLESLLSHARFTHFIPVLTYRYARERLRLEALALD